MFNMLTYVSSERGLSHQIFLLIEFLSMSGVFH